MSDRATRPGRVPLEQDLETLAAALTWPPTPDLAGRQAWAAEPVRIQDLPAHAAPSPRRAMPAWLRPALAVILALVFAAVAIDPVRAAIGDLLGIAGGERVVRSERVGTGAPLALGERVNLDEARARAGFDPLVPGRLGPPREVRFGGDLGDRAVSLVYDDTVLTEIPDASAIFAIKRIAASVQVTWTPLGDAQAAWIDRGPRVLVIPHADSGRPAARRSALPGAGVLLWDRQGVAMRLETRRGRAEALAIARSLRRPQ